MNRNSATDKRPDAVVNDFFKNTEEEKLREIINQKMSRIINYEISKEMYLKK